MKNELRLDDPARDPAVTRVATGPALIAIYDAAYLAERARLALVAEAKARADAHRDAHRMQAAKDAPAAASRLDRAREDANRRAANRVIEGIHKRKWPDSR